jgi:hypothetical protein
VSYMCRKVQTFYVFTVIICGYKKQKGNQTLIAYFGKHDMASGSFVLHLNLFHNNSTREIRINILVANAFGFLIYLFTYLFIYMGYIAKNGRMIYERCIGKALYETRNLSATKC